jgi:hypothetical protein
MWTSIVFPPSSKCRSVRSEVEVPPGIIPKSIGWFLPILTEIATGFEGDPWFEQLAKVALRTITPNAIAIICLEKLCPNLE